MDQVLQEFAQEILLQLVYLLVPLVVVWAGKMVVSAWTELKMWQPNIAMYIEDAAEFAVNAAEQVGLTGALAELADSKLDYATDIAKKYLVSKGLKHIDLDLLRAAIEAEIKKANFPHAEG